MMDKIASLASASGWSAVYMSEDESAFVVPLVSWALVKGWNEHEWVEEDSTCIVGMVLSANGYSIIPAPEVDFVENETRQGEDAALFCGYLPPGEDINTSSWKPLWKKEMEFNNLTESQKIVIQNLRAGREIYYPIDSADIQWLIKNGWLIATDQPGEYLVSTSL